MDILELLYVVWFWAAVVSWFPIFVIYSGPPQPDLLYGFVARKYRRAYDIFRTLPAVILICWCLYLSVTAEPGAWISPIRIILFKQSI